MTKKYLDEAADYGAEHCPCNYDEEMQKAGICEANALAQGFVAGYKKALDDVIEILYNNKCCPGGHLVHEKQIRKLIEE